MHCVLYMRQLSVLSQMVLPSLLFGFHSVVFSFCHNTYIRYSRNIVNIPIVSEVTLVMTHMQIVKSHSEDFFVAIYFCLQFNSIVKLRLISPVPFVTLPFDRKLHQLQQSECQYVFCKGQPHMYFRIPRLYSTIPNTSLQLCSKKAYKQCMNEEPDASQ